MATNKDYYATLGVSKSASADELKSAYRKLVMKYHPDRNPGDNVAEEKFKEVNEAYEILKDPQKKALYDQYGSAAFEQGGGNAGGFGGFGGGGFSFEGGLGDIFEELFGGAFGGKSSNSQQSNRGRDLQYDVRISLEEAYRGKDINISIDVPCPCTTCSGKGGSGIETCSACKGHGKVRSQRGFMIMEQACASCQGQGQKITNPCKTCSGSGRINQRQNLEVKIPAGSDNGMRLRLNGKGEAGYRGGTAGDLYVRINILDHNIFARNEEDLFAHIPIMATTAMLGGNIEVPTIDGGKVEVKITAGTQDSSKMRIKGKGMPIYGTKNFGDLTITLEVEIPVNLNKDQKKLVESLAASLSEKNQPKQSSFFEKIKKFWNS